MGNYTSSPKMIRLYKHGVRYSGFGQAGCEPKRLKVASSMYKNKFYMHLTVVATKEEHRDLKSFSGFMVDDLESFRCNLKRGGGPLRIQRGFLII
jgi:hypothetical protein